MRGLKIWKRFRFCRRDEYGIRPQCGLLGEFVKSTPLGRELTLRTQQRAIRETCDQIPGIYEWGDSDTHTQDLPAISAHLAFIAAALRRYKARRVERGLFHFVPKANSAVFWTLSLSPLDAHPGAQREAVVDKLRRRRKKRAAAAALLKKKNKKKPTEQACAVKMRLIMRPSAVLYLVYIVFISVLSYMIAFL